MRAMLTAAICGVLGVFACLLALTGAAASPASDDIVVTRDDRSLPDGCRPAAVARRLQTVIARYNRGGTLAGLFDFSTRGARTSRGSLSFGDSAAFNRADHERRVARLVDRRRARGERLRLRAVSVSFRRSRAMDDFSVDLDRTATDATRDEIRMRGKGAISCRDGKVYLLAGATVRADMPPVGPPCPRTREPGVEIAACVR